MSITGKTQKSVISNYTEFLIFSILYQFKNASYVCIRNSGILLNMQLQNVTMQLHFVTAYLFSLAEKHNGNYNGEK